MASIVVYVEQEQGKPVRASLECLGAAKATGRDVVAVVAREGAAAAAATLGKFGASRAVCLAGSGPYSPDATARDVAKIVLEQKADAFLAAATASGKDLAPRVAAGLDSTLLSDCTGIDASGGKLRVTRPWLAGKAIAKLSSTAPVLCATTRPNAFAIAEGQGTAEVLTQPASADGKAVVVSVAAKDGGKLDVKEAPVVVSGGRGLKGPEHFRLIEELAAAFGNAATGASRASSTPAGARTPSRSARPARRSRRSSTSRSGSPARSSTWPGCGLRKVIVAINKDAEAPIFKVADYGLVGDAFEVLPALTAAVREIRAHK
jgi:electron transfer flavoprotein alpha subunit